MVGRPAQKAVLAADTLEIEDVDNRLRGLGIAGVGLDFNRSRIGIGIDR